jgi:hypothetical protein
MIKLSVFFVGFKDLRFRLSFSFFFFFFFPLCVFNGVFKYIEEGAIVTDSPHPPPNYAYKRKAKSHKWPFRQKRTFNSKIDSISTIGTKRQISEIKDIYEVSYMNLQ